MVLQKGWRRRRHCAALRGIGDRCSSACTLPRIRSTICGPPSRACWSSKACMGGSSRDPAALRYVDQMERSGRSSDPDFVGRLTPLTISRRGMRVSSENRESSASEGLSRVRNCRSAAAGRPNRLSKACYENGLPRAMVSSFQRAMLILTSHLRRERARSPESRHRYLACGQP